MAKSNFKVEVDFDSKKILKEVTKQAKEGLKKQSYEFNCPKCDHKIESIPGVVTCPSCGSTFDFDLNFE